LKQRIQNNSEATFFEIVFISKANSKNGILSCHEKNLHYKKPYNLQICLFEYLSTNELKITNVFVLILGISYLIKGSVPFCKIE
jgi:hypothetical protein